MMPQKLAYHYKASESLWSYLAQNFTVSGECLTQHTLYTPSFISLTLSTLLKPISSWTTYIDEGMWEGDFTEKIQLLRPSNNPGIGQQ